MHPLCLTLPLLLPPLAAEEPDPAVFEQELQRVRRKMELGDWDVALRRLESALDAHASGEYVLAHLGEIEMALKRCLFWRERGEVDLAAGLKGELQYDLRSGKIKLHYEAEAPTDFEPRGLARVLPVVFSGPYSIEIVDGAEPTVIVCARGQESVTASFSRVFHLGVGNPNQEKPTQRSVELRSSLRDRNGKLVEETRSKDFTSKRSLKERRYKVQVSGSSIKTSFNGKSLLSRTKPRDLWGQIAFGLSVPKAEIRIEGEAKGWLQARLDAAVEEDWKAYEADWELAPHLPAELAARLEAPSSSAPSPTAQGDATPLTELDAEGVDSWNEAVRLMQEGDAARALETVDALLARFPALAEGHRLRSGALIQLHRREEAALALRECARLLPSELETRRQLVELLLLSGRFQEALDEVGAAVSEGHSVTALQGLSVTANKALHGPAWSRKNEYASRHFEVASDLSKEVCRSIALELEENFRHVSRRLDLGTHLESRRFQVYVFSSASRYADYVSDVFRGRAEHTLGMYSPFLKQLLVLNSPQHDMLMHTVRHEGFHQLIDSELDDPPTWLNEGLAEYFAAARTPTGWKDGQPNQPRLEALQGRLRGKLIPLAEFLFQDHATFLKDADLGYAQAWGLVQFLRHSSRSNAARLEELIAELRAGRDNRGAIESAFDGQDLQALDVALEAYLMQL